VTEQLKCENCGYTTSIPMHCGKSMHIEKIEEKNMLVCWMGPGCGKQAIPDHCDKPMIIK
jgi:hypothetical protein